tara:strand:+ start:280 stop:909 length:630 start_codon:yes stop_codon:yes gene_type:complete
MATRIGKYKVSKKESALSVVDGGFADGLFQRKNVFTTAATTAATNLLTSESGKLINLGGTVAQIQVINLPTITTADIGTYYDFVVTVSGNSGAAGSYTINTGGHATDETGGSRTAGYDDFIGCLSVVDSALPAMPANDASNVIPAAGEGTLVLADDTTNAVIAVGSHFRCTAVAASTIGTASGNTWFITGTLVTAQATGFVTTNLFTAP